MIWTHRKKIGTNESGRERDGKKLNNPTQRTRTATRKRDEMRTEWRPIFFLIARQEAKRIENESKWNTYSVSEGKHSSRGDDENETEWTGRKNANILSIFFFCLFISRFVFAWLFSFWFLEMKITLDRERMGRKRARERVDERVRKNVFLNFHSSSHFSIHFIFIFFVFVSLPARHRSSHTSFSLRIFCFSHTHTPADYSVSPFALLPLFFLLDLF